MTYDGEKFPAARQLRYAYEDGPNADTWAVDTLAGPEVLTGEGVLTAFFVAVPEDPMLGGHATIESLLSDLTP